MAIEALPFSIPVDRAAFDRLRDSVDDGHRYELIDGVVVVSPGPRLPHQIASANLFLLLHEAAPPDVLVLYAPFDIVLSDDTVLQPDLFVARRSDFTQRDLPVAPLLAVEILSPSTRAFDLHVKRDRLERAACPHYWVVDPGLAGPASVTAWRLVDGGYVEAGRAEGAQRLTLDAPFDVGVIPDRLIDP